jgi:hypothetical protein
VALCSLILAATPSPQSATIRNSGSTNFAGYTIEVRADGTASAAASNRNGDVLSTPKPFTLDAALATSFFTHLAAAQAEGAKVEPCMKSASFGSTTRVSWDGWTSPDLSCPPASDAAAALVHDVQTITTASGIESTPRRSFGPVMRQPEPSPTAS